MWENNVGQPKGIHLNVGKLQKKKKVKECASSPFQVHLTTMRVLLLLVSLLIGLVAAGQFRVKDYERNQVLSSFMSIYWNVDEAANNITIAVMANTTGMISFLRSLMNAGVTL